MQVKHNYCAVFDYGKDDVITSLKLAEDFNKRHTHILRDIERNIRFLKDANPDLVKKLNIVFEKSTYKTEAGNVYPMYNLTRNAVLFMCMHYRGDDAFQFRLMFCYQMDKLCAELGTQPPSIEELLQNVR